jgi:hypothetical protein
MTTGDTLAWVFGIVGVLVWLQGIWLTSRALFPTRVKRSADSVRRHGVGSFFLGLPLTFAAVLFTVFLVRRGAPGQGLAWIVGGMAFIYANVGVSGLVTLMGERLNSPADADRPWRATVRGGITLQLAFLMPVLGWALAAISLIVGMGAMTLSFFGSPRRDLQAALHANRMFGNPSPEMPSLSSEASR